jgi:hypothetical protein
MSSTASLALAARPRASTRVGDRVRRRPIRRAHPLGTSPSPRRSPLDSRRAPLAAVSVGDDATLPSSAASSSASPDDPLGALLSRVEREGTPFAISEAVDIHPKMVYRFEPNVAPDGGALWSCAGARAYASVATRFPRVEDDQLLTCARVVSRCSRVGPLEVAVRWETSFIPRKLEWLYRLGEAWPGVEVTTYDILDKMGELSRFSWRGLAALFWRAATRGEMRIPAALVRGASTLRFQTDEDEDRRRRDDHDHDRSDEGETKTLTLNTPEPSQSPPRVRLRAHDETVDLVRHVNAGDVRNRRVARDVLEFLDARKPPDTSLEAWDDAVEDAVRWRDVPGMGMFDVDGLEEAEDRAEMYADAVAVMAFGVVLLLVFGVGVGEWYLRGLAHDRAMAQMLETGAF